MTDDLTRLKSALADRYVIVSEIGSGGMAVVYLAEDVKHRRKVAVKVLRPEIAAALGAERFVREIEIAGNLSHPLILPFFDSGDVDGNLFYVMPFVEGESLRERIDREAKLPLDDAIRLTENIAAALTYAHQQGIVHRDVKPENILLTGGTAVVADFGIARAVTVAGGTRLTETGVAIGTPDYMSPEQAFGDANIDGRADVYALGCVVYEMVSGRTPFDAPTPQALLAKHAVDTPRALRTIDPDIPLFVERAVERALAKEPARRFKTPNELAETLRSQIVVPKTGRRRLAVLPPTNLTNDPEQEYFVAGMHNALITELQQVGIAVIARTSVLQFENTQKPVRDIAAELGVDALIESSVSRTDNSVELEVRVVDGTTEEYLSDPISRGGELENIVALYRELTSAIAAEVQEALTPQNEARLATARTVNPEAYEAFLKGQFHIMRVTPADFQQALQYFESALEIDPDYTLAHVGVAYFWIGLNQMNLIRPREAGPKARAAILKALELDSTAADVQYISACVKTWIDFDWSGGEEAFLRTFDLNPNYPIAHALYAHFLITLCRPDEALSHMDKAVKLDPFNPVIRSVNGMAFHMMDMNERALEEFQRLLQTFPNHAIGLLGLRYVYRALGRDEESLEAAAAYYAALGLNPALEALNQGAAAGGFCEAMKRAADAWVVLAEQMYVSGVEVAYLYAYAGENAKALHWLERAFEERDPNLPYLHVWPGLRGMHSEPQFIDLVRRLGLPGPR